MNPPNHKNLFDLLDELRAIAQMGLHYCKDPYDLQRYNRLMEIATSEYAAIAGLSQGEIKNRFSRELGYITPKVGIQGAVINGAGEILLEQRADDSCWGLPAGWMEVGETPEQCIQRELLEETNLQVVPEKIIGFHNRLAGAYKQPHASVHILFWCRLVGGELKKSFESLDMKFCDMNTITNWHMDHQQVASAAMEYWRSLR
jgi:ADP-ribose pyrophosphatase YjhB (NUDIX family)